MSDIELFHFPGSCSRVAMAALEKIGVDYSDRAINIFAGEQAQPEYLTISPKGKVPACRVDGELLTENPAINMFLDQRFPEANLLPGHDDPILKAQAQGALIWCSNTLHPTVRGMFKPQAYSNDHLENVREEMTGQFYKHAAYVEEQVKDGWWFGDTWSIVDHYMFFGMSVAKIGGASFDKFPNIVAHSEKLLDLPFFKSTVEREKKSLEAVGVTLPPAIDLAAGLT